MSAKRVYTQAISLERWGFVREKKSRLTQEAVIDVENSSTSDHFASTSDHLASTLDHLASTAANVTVEQPGTAGEEITSPVSSIVATENTNLAVAEITKAVPLKDMLDSLFEGKPIHHYQKCSASCQLNKNNYKQSSRDKFNHNWLFDKTLSFCHKTGFWWLVFEQTSDMSDGGMFCVLCRKHNPGHEKKQTDNQYVNKPARRYKRAAVADHAKSKQHKSAIEMELCMRVSSFHKEIEEQESVRYDIMYGAFMAVYWLAKEDIATSKFFSLLTLMEEVGLDKMKFFNYTSRYTIRDILLCISKQLHMQTQQNIEGSYGILVDDVTDLSSILELVITFVQYVNHNTGQVTTDFLFIEDLLKQSNSANAETITKVLVDYLEQSEIPLANLSSMCSDGAAVMMGRVNGVAARLHQITGKYLLACHCVCHKLALACNDSSGHVKQIKRVLDITTELWLRFSKSPKRTSVLMNVQLKMKHKDPEIDPKSRKILTTKLKKSCKTRWLSQSASVKAINDDFVPILCALKCLADEENDVQAAGLLAFMNQGRFIGTIYILNAVLPILANLSKTFQTGNICFSQIVPAVNHTLEQLDEIATFSPSTPVDIMVKETKPDGKLQLTGIVIDDNLYRELIALQKNYIESLKQSIKIRFGDSNEVLAALDIFNPIRIPQVKQPGFNDYGNESISLLSTTLLEGNPEKSSKVSAEWKLFKHTLIQMQSVIPQEVKKSKDPGAPTKWALEQILKMQTTYGAVYPILLSIAEVALSIPLSNAWPERAASAVKRIKTRLRNRMKTDMLDSLLRISINGPPVSSSECKKLIDDSVNLFLSLKKRRKLPRYESSDQEFGFSGACASYASDSPQSSDSDSEDCEE